MSEHNFAQLDQLQQDQGPAAAIDQVIATLREQKEYHRLFDALMLKTKFQMGLPLAQPTSFDDVPEDKRREFEDHYINAAREVGHLFVQDGRIPQAWVYLRTIHEPDKVTEALEALELPDDPDEQTEEIINIALFEGANPVKGLKMLLHSHGTCNTITALEQQLPQLAPQDRRQAAGLLVETLYEELKDTLQSEIQSRMPFAAESAGDSIHELIQWRDWLFEEDNYHIDVSHLNAVVRFARNLEAESPQLRQAMELAEYGMNLSQQFHYDSDPPFDDFCTAHRHYFGILTDQGREQGLAYFREKLASISDSQDKQLTAYVLTDLLRRIGRLDEALELADQYLRTIEDPQGFSFAALCQQACRMETLKQAAREKGDLVGYTAALIQSETPSASQTTSHAAD